MSTLIKHQNLPDEDYFLKNVSVEKPFYAMLQALNASELTYSQLTLAMQKLSQDGILLPKLFMKDNGEHRHAYFPELDSMLLVALSHGFVEYSKEDDGLPIKITQKGATQALQLKEKRPFRDADELVVLLVKDLRDSGDIEIKIGEAVEEAKVLSPQGVRVKLYARYYNGGLRDGGDWYLDAHHIKMLDKIKHDGKYLSVDKIAADEAIQKTLAELYGMQLIDATLNEVSLARSGESLLARIDKYQEGLTTLISNSEKPTEWDHRIWFSLSDLHDVAVMVDNKPVPDRKAK